MGNSGFPRSALVGHCSLCGHRIYAHEEYVITGGDRASPELWHLPCRDQMIPELLRQVGDPTEAEHGEPPGEATR